MNKWHLAICFLLVSVFAQAQENTEEKTEHSRKGSHQLTVGLGHTHLSEGVKDGKTEWLGVPSWTFDYNYWLAHKWAIGLHTDLVTESFVVKTSEGNELERITPFAVIPSVMFKPGRHLSLLTGFGREFEKENNLNLIRVGAEYGWELPRNFEFSVGLMWDNKIDHYDAWVLTFNVSKAFARRHH